MAAKLITREEVKSWKDSLYEEKMAGGGSEVVESIENVEIALGKMEEQFEARIWAKKKS